MLKNPVILLTFSLPPVGSQTNSIRITWGMFKNVCFWTPPQNCEIRNQSVYQENCISNQHIEATLPRISFYRKVIWVSLEGALNFILRTTEALNIHT